MNSGRQKSIAEAFPECNWWQRFCIRVALNLVLTIISASVTWPLWHFIGVPLLALPELSWIQIAFILSLVRPTHE